MEKPILVEAQSSCRAHDLYCKTEEAVIVWSQYIIHDCPLYQIETLKVNITNGLAVTDNLAFKITTKEFIEECDITVYDTTEGIMLSEDKDAVSIEKSEVEFKDNYHLLLGNMDAR